MSYTQSFYNDTRETDGMVEALEKVDAVVAVGVVEVVEVVGAEEERVVKDKEVHQVPVGNQSKVVEVEDGKAIVEMDNISFFHLELYTRKLDKGH